MQDALIIDETHTICAGPGGYTHAHNLDPDFLVFGKPIGGGVPGSTYGFTQAVADAIAARQDLEDCDVGGIGGTLAGNALSLAAMHATLEKVLTQKAFDHMIPLAERWTAGIEKAIAEFDVPWHVTRLGCRAEYLFSRDRPATVRSSRRDGFRAGALHASVRDEPRNSAHAIPQHGLDVARNQGRTY